MIPAHDSPLAALAFDASGTKLATASEKVGRSQHRALVCYLCDLFMCEERLIPVVASFSSVVSLSLPPRAQSFVSFQSQRDRSSLSFGEE